jgi:putative ABC transport system permease protein
VRCHGNTQLSGFLFGVGARDPLTSAVIPLLLAAVGLIACWFPARRAAKMDPLAALRHEQETSRHER